MRRALFVLGAVLVLSGVGFVVLPLLEARQLGAQLVKDVATLRARAVQRTPPVQLPIHDNGFQCLAGILKVTPRDLAPFDSLDPSSPLAPWLRGEQPVSALPEDLKKKLRGLDGWADNVRACGASRELRYVPGAEPWDRSDPLLHVGVALSQLTVVQVRDALEAGRPVDAALRCEATLGVAFDLTYLNTAGVVAALGVARQLLPVCAAALNALPPEARAEASNTWATLLSRVVSIHDLLDTLRVTDAVHSFGPLVELEGLPPATPPVFEDSMPRALRERRLWPRWDKAFRALVAAPDAATRGARAEEIEALCEGDHGLPLLPVTVDVAVQEQRLRDLTVISQALTWLAAGAAGKPPVGERTAAGLVLPLDPPVTLPLNP